MQTIQKRLAATGYTDIIVYGGIRYLRDVSGDGGGLMVLVNVKTGEKIKVEGTEIVDIEEYTEIPQASGSIPSPNDFPDDMLISSNASPKYSVLSHVHYEELN